MMFQTSSMMAENLRNSGAILCYILQALKRYYETKVRLLWQDGIAFLSYCFG